MLPSKQGSLHGVHGKTADSGFSVHSTFPLGLKKESIWLAYYVSLSRPRSFGQLLSHGLPDRSIIESGPPEQISKTNIVIMISTISIIIFMITPGQRIDSSVSLLWLNPLIAAYGFGDKCIDSSVSVWGF